MVTRGTGRGTTAGSGTIRHLLVVSARMMTISLQANDSPTHCRAPPPNGWNAVRGIDRARSGDHRSGSKAAGSGYTTGSRCRMYGLNTTVAPCGRSNPPRLAGAVTVLVSSHAGP